MTNYNQGQSFTAKEKKAIKKKIHRALLDARNARHRGNEEEAEKIIRQTMAELSPAAYRASREGGFNWVVEALKPLDEMMLPGDDEDCR